LRGSGQAAIATLQRYVDEAARDPAAIAIGTRVSAGTGSEAEWRRGRAGVENRSVSRT